MQRAQPVGATICAADCSAHSAGRHSASRQCGNTTIWPAFIYGERMTHGRAADGCSRYGRAKLAKFHSFSRGWGSGSELSGPHFPASDSLRTLSNTQWLFKSLQMHGSHSPSSRWSMYFSPTTSLHQHLIKIDRSDFGPREHTHDDTGFYDTRYEPQLVRS